ncbi:hypothetical protein FB476_1807 [Ornithinimicrobium humiphilum]|uniref:Uncharacterized protein n=2 Tax=Ornithinimicrobium humiphilum TaxID=125288 RepID=A0A543KPA8_9MICO|nr:hypothetical protein FB476_1807 [Ornithinimicrobium humiphilum]
MTEHPVGDSGWADVEPHQNALMSLHAREEDGAGFVPGVRRMGTGQALHTLAEASLDDVPVSARIGTLGELARAGFPELETAEAQYVALAESVAQARTGIDAQQLLDDVKEAAGDGVPFSALTSGRSLEHHEAAFVGQDVCSVRRVVTGGLAATWVFSEFETNAPFEKVADWVDPRSWPRRGPMLFRGMDLVGSGRPVSLPGPPRSEEHWHGIFHEKVQIVGPVNTLLHCDFWRDARAAGMTYDLALSLDDLIEVDRGFLTVNDLGPVRRVKALKIVGFRQKIWDQVTTLVRPFWTEWVRRAVEGGSSSRPVETPGPGPAGPDLDPGRAPGHDRPSGGRNLSWLEPAEDWIQFAAESSRTYVDLLDDMAGAAMQPDVRPADLLGHQRRIFNQLARDWSQAWVHGMGLLGQIADEGLEHGVAPPDRSGATFTAAASGVPGRTVPADQAGAEGTTVPLLDLRPDDAPAVSDLVSIEAGGARIPAASIAATVTPLGEGHAVRLRVDGTSWSPGLYVGEVVARPGAAPAPVQLYISRTTEV